MNGHRQEGFSMLEMIVVLAILGLALSLVLMRGPMRSPRLDAQAAARDLAGTLRVARGRAIAENRPVTVAFADNLYRIDGSSVRRVPYDVMLTGNGAIRFAPDGSSSGGVVMVQAAASRIAVLVDWLTGRVQTQQQP